MSRIMLIRHAETDLAGRFCGQSDPVLNARGRQQAADLVTRLAGTPIDAIYTSDLRRAHSTAQAIALQRGLSCQLRPALREIDFGEWEGLSWDEITARDPDFAERWASEFPSLSAPGGEGIDNFAHRVLGAIGDLAAGLSASPARSWTLAVVTHGGVLRLVLEELCGLSAELAWERSRHFCSIVTMQPTYGRGERGAPIAWKLLP